MSRSFDVYDDVNKQQLFLLEQYFTLPDFVKSAQVESARPDVPATAHADVLNQRYPCHNSSSTWLSQAYFLLNRSQYTTKEAESIQGRLTKFASFWGLENIINDLTKKWEKLAESNPTLNDKDYALVVEHEGGKIRRMPLHNELAVKASADYLKRNRSKYPYEWRKTAALNLLSESQTLDPETTEFLEKTAGFGVINPKSAAIALRKRAALLTNTKIKTELQKVAEAIECSVPDLASTEKFIKATDAFDREYGMTVKYASALSLPEDAVELTCVKLAATIANHVQLTTGRSYPLDQLAKLPLEKIAEVLGEDFVDAVTGPDGITLDQEKFAQIATTLPRNDALLLEKAMSAAGED